MTFQRIGGTHWSKSISQRQGSIASGEEFFQALVGLIELVLCLLQFCAEFMILRQSFLQGLALHAEFEAKIDLLAEDLQGLFLLRV